MMTMATSTNAKTTPWCQHIQNCTETPSLPLGESLASKVGTRGNNSQKNHPPTVLREIPTRISTLPPTAAVVDRHDDDIERQPPAPRPYLLPTLTTPKSVSGSFFPQYDNDHDVDRTLGNKIAQLMCRWPPTTDGAHCETRTITCNTQRHISNLPPPETISIDDEPFDYGSTIDKIVAKVEQMKRRWPATAAPTDPRPYTSACLAPCHSSSTSPTEPPSPRTLPTHLETKTLLAVECHNPTATDKFAEPPKFDMATGDDSTDPSLLDAVQSLDNFLIKYPRQISFTNALDRYQPSPDRRLSLSRHDLLAQQTQVLHTANVILGELCEKISRFLDVLSRSTPSLISVKLQLRPWTMRAPALPALRLPTKNRNPSQQSIPAKPPFTGSNNKLMMHWTKDHLRPP